MAAPAPPAGARTRTRASLHPSCRSRRTQVLGDEQQESGTLDIPRDARRHCGERALGRLLSAARESSHPVGRMTLASAFLLPGFSGRRCVMEEGPMNDELPTGRNLESHRKEAKRWLDAL